MKKIYASVFMAALLAFGAIACAAPSDDVQPQTTVAMRIGSPIMTVNGEERSIDEQGTSPIAVDGRTLLPVRAVIEAVGGTVSWDQDTQSVFIGCDGTLISLQLGSASAFVNEELHTLDVAPVAIDGRTMLPIRFIAESLDFSVDWDGETQTVTITK